MKIAFFPSTNIKHIKLIVYSCKIEFNCYSNHRPKLLPVNFP